MFVIPLKAEAWIKLDGCLGRKAMSPTICCAKQNIRVWPLEPKVWLWPWAEVKDSGALHILI